MAAVMVTFTGESTLFVVILKMPEVSPAFTTTLEESPIGELAGADKSTIFPPRGAGALNVTVPTAELPLITEAGDTVTAETVVGLIVSIADPL